jgi:hypothetical protein
MLMKNREFSGAALVKFDSLTEAEDAIERLRNTIIPGVNTKRLGRRRHRST